MKKGVPTNIFSLSAFFSIKMMHPEGNQFLTSKWLHSFIHSFIHSFKFQAKFLSFALVLEEQRMV